MEQSKDDQKLTSEDLFQDEVSSKATSINIRVPAFSWVSSQAILKVSMATLHMPEPHLEKGEHVVNDQVVLHIMEIVLIQQYIINMGICLFVDKAREPVKKELRQLHNYLTYHLLHSHD